MAENNDKSDEKTQDSKDSEVKCDNHPRRKARVFSADGAIAPVNWCDECLPDWYKDDEK